MPKALDFYQTKNEWAIHLWIIIMNGKTSWSNLRAGGMNTYNFFLKFSKIVACLYLSQNQQVLRYLSSLFESCWTKYLTTISYWSSLMPFKELIFVALTLRFYFFSFWCRIERLLFPCFPRFPRWIFF